MKLMFLQFLISTLSSGIQLTLLTAVRLPAGTVSLSSYFLFQGFGSQIDKAFKTEASKIE